MSELDVCKEHSLFAYYYTFNFIQSNCQVWLTLFYGNVIAYTISIYLFITIWVGLIEVLSNANNAY